MMGMGVSLWSAIQNIFIALSSGLVQLPRNGVISDKRLTSPGPSVLRCERVCDGHVKWSGPTLPSPDTAPQPFSVPLCAAKNIAQELARQ